ncbi:MAG: hypothetical protein JWN07_20, partial [Hyphomicrobiales bacterium]|nr:hypothetical protein [Hyphomicrobiales bacterium]
SDKTKTRTYPLKNAYAYGQINVKKCLI